MKKHYEHYVRGDIGLYVRKDNKNSSSFAIITYSNGEEYHLTKECYQAFLIALTLGKVNTEEEFLKIFS